ncbi:porin [Janthinobacterium sp. Marseille]|nr:porin [Janthinobacterium sp. Marseille]ABR90352.1 porin [Janthinobacterium sp. Marseille]
MRITRRKSAALAISAACGLPFSVQAEPSVTVYGKLYPQITNYSLSRGTAAGTSVSTLVSPVTATPQSLSGTVVESSNSYIGFRGSEKIGDGLTAMFQLEASIGIDTGAQSSPDIFFSRETFVGLEGGLGEIKMGKLDTVYKSLGDTLSFGGVSSGNFVSGSNIMSKNGFGTNSAHRFHERPANTVMYTTPEVSGFQGLLGYSFGEIPDDRSRGNIISAGITYKAGPWYVALANEQHENFYGASRNLPAALRNITGGTGAGFIRVPGTSSKDTATRATAQYQFTSNTRAELNLVRMKLAESGGAVGRFKSYTHNAWLLTAEHKMNAWAVVGSYGQASAGECELVGAGNCNTDGLNASMLSMGVFYTLSKRTQLYSLFSRMRNGHSANYSNAGDAQPPGVGQNLTQLALGISHRF